MIKISTEYEKYYSFEIIQTWRQSLLEVIVQADLIAVRWSVPENKAKPILLMLGGFQGSGKTAVL